MVRFIEYWNGNKVETVCVVTDDTHHTSGNPCVICKEVTPLDAFCCAEKIGSGIVTNGACAICCEHDHY